MVNSSAMLAALAPSSPSLMANWPRLPRRGLKRPRGLWKARRRLDPATASSYQLTQAPEGGGGGGGATSSSSGRGSDTEHDEEERDVDESGDEDCDEMSQGSSSSKRQRRDSGSSSSVMELWAAGAAVQYVEADSDMPASSGVSPPEDNNSNGKRAAVVRAPLISDMVTTSIAESASSCKETCELKDWEELQETLARASELYDHEDLLGSISLLRAVIHECHRFLRRFPDPSHFFSRLVPQQQRERSRSSDSVDRLGHDPRSPNLAEKRSRNIDRMSTNPTPDSDDQSSHRSRRHHELPTAFHAVLGIALFLFGNIIAQNTTFALSREPNTPSPYWLAALDVFDAGNNLPCHTSGNDSSDAATAAADDNWRVAIAWGRSLVSLAYEATTKSSPPPSPSSLISSPSSPRSHTQRYPPRSPLAAIAAMRMPGTAHSRASAQELLTYAADQFARGIFHMPHSLPHAARPQELFTLASEVLAVAERLDDAEARRRWATWADAVFHQMHMEADVDAWRARIAVARGRCWLAVGSARADEMEDALERDDMRVLQSKEAEDSRAALVMAISFFDRAKGSASTDSPETSLTDMQPLLAEALLSLANLTSDEDAREALYARAQVEGGEAVRRELGPPSPTSSRQTITADIQMDES